MAQSPQYANPNPSWNSGGQNVIEESFECNSYSSSLNKDDFSLEHSLHPEREGVATPLPVYHERSRDSAELTEEETPLNQGRCSVDSDTETMRVAYSGTVRLQQVDENYPQDDQHEIDPENLSEMRQKLGNGHFGTVFLALLRESDGRQVAVAVKRSKMMENKKLKGKEREETFQQQLKSLQREKSIMSSMGPHPNILRLIGAVTDPDNFCVVTEYCEYGSLDTFLRTRKDEDKFNNEYIVHGKDGYRLVESKCNWRIKVDDSWAENFEQRRTKGIVTTSDLMWFGLQIAQAMEFLTNQSILHRDIALRNVLLANGYIVKVADFGLSRKIVDGLYQPSTAPEMPIGYLAPEVLEHDQFSKHSESWAFGIVLWELFTLAACQPYFKECRRVIDRYTISAYLGADKRLPIPEEAPISMHRLISQLWRKEPTARPDFEKCQSTILADLQNANPKLAKLALQMHSQKKVPYVQLENDYIFNEKQIDVRSVRKNRLTKCRIVSILCCCIPLVVLLAIIAYLGTRAQKEDPQPDHKGFTADQKEIIADHKEFIADHKGFVADRWSWTFNASIIYNTKIDQAYYGNERVLNLSSSSGCGVSKWKPYFIRNKPEANETSFRVLFLLQYLDGPRNLHAWRSMVLFTGDGRQIMIGNDFHRNGFVYNLEQYDNKVWPANSTFLPNTSVNDPLTLKIELFVDPASTACKYKKQIPQHPINYTEECKRLPTNTKLFFNGACYVGSNTPARFDEAIQLCNDIPSAGTSRLAWVESEVLLHKLQDVLKIRNHAGKLVNEAYYIGAKDISENDVMEKSINGKWHWIDSDKQPIKPFPEKFKLWSEEKPIDEDNTSRRFAVFSPEQMKLNPVKAAEWFRYLCEYRARE